MNAIEFLVKEHNKVRTMLTDIADQSHQFETQKKRFDMLAEDLLRHENMEHEIWYPHFKDNLSKEVKHLVGEEKGAEKEIKKLESMKTESAWKEHFVKFKQDVEKHAKEEEMKLFPEVEKLLSKDELENIGESMARYKRDYPQSH